MKIAVFGGSFDPPHKGHEQIVQEVLKNLDIDKLFIVPTWLSPFKKRFFARPKKRLEWIKELWGGVEKVHICTFELKNARPTPSMETIEYLYEKYPVKKCFFIIGADNLAKLHQWDRYEDLSKKVEFVVATRDGIPIPKNLQKLQINATISSSKVRETFNYTDIPTKIIQSVQEFYKEQSVNNTIAEKIIHLLDEKKGENIQVFDMQGKDYFADTVIIATTMGERHALALLDDLKKLLKEENEKYLHVEASGEWVVLDLGDVLIHLMSSEYRARYNMEAFLSDFDNLKKHTDSSTAKK